MLISPEQSSAAISRSSAYFYLFISVKELGLKGRVRALSQSASPSLAQLPTIDSSRFHYEFDVNGNLAISKSYLRDGSVHSRTQYFYDGEDLLRSESIDCQDRLIQTTTYLYERGQCIAWSASNATGETERQARMFYQKGVLSRMSIFAGNQFVLDRRFSYDQGVLSFQDSRIFSTLGVYAERALTFFDAEGRPKESFALKPDGSPLGDGRYEYVYDERGFRARVLCYDDFSEASEPTSIHTYAYTTDETGNWISQFVFSLEWDERLLWTFTRAISYFPEKSS